MTTRSVLGVAVSAALAILAAGSVGATIPWRGAPLDAAFAEATSRNRLVLLDLYTDWSARCAQLSRETYTDPQVQSTVVASFVPVRLNADRGGGEYARRYHLHGKPELLVLRPDGEIAGHITRFMTPREFVLQLRILDDGYRNVAHLEARGAAGDCSAEAELAAVDYARNDAASAGSRLARAEAMAGKTPRDAYLAAAESAAGDHYQQLADTSTTAAEVKSDQALAVTHYERAATVSPDTDLTAYAHIAAAESLCAIGQIAQALDEANAVVAAPDAPPGRVVQARALMRAISTVPKR